MGVKKWVAWKVNNGLLVRYDGKKDEDRGSGDISDSEIVASNVASKPILKDDKEKNEGYASVRCDENKAKRFNDPRSIFTPLGQELFQRYVKPNSQEAGKSSDDGSRATSAEESAKKEAGNISGNMEGNLTTSQEQASVSDEAGLSHESQRSTVTDDHVIERICGVCRLSDEPYEPSSNKKPELETSRFTLCGECDFLISKLPSLINERINSKLKTMFDSGFEESVDKLWSQFMSFLENASLGETRNSDANHSESSLENITAGKISDANMNIGNEKIDSTIAECRSPDKDGQDSERMILRRRPLKMEPQKLKPRKSKQKVKKKSGSAFAPKVDVTLDPENDLLKDEESKNKDVNLKEPLPASKSKPLYCDQCKLNFSAESALKRHNVNFHMTGPPYQCDICKSVLQDLASWKRHKRDHSLAQKRTCPICKKSFSRTFYLKLHMEIHNGHKYMCDICGKQYSQEPTLKLHRMVHMGQTPFVCDVCNRSFKSRASLKYHQSICPEAGELKIRAKNYVCEVCGKSFLQNSGLTVHRRVHFGEKPFACNSCSKTFSTKPNLKAHLRTHSDDKPFTCDVCKARFRQLGSLKDHKKIHTGEKPFACDFCSSKFRRRAFLKKHLKTHSTQESTTTQAATVLDIAQPLQLSNQDVLHLVNNQLGNACPTLENEQAMSSMNIPGDQTLIHEALLATTSANHLPESLIPVHSSQPLVSLSSHLVNHTLNDPSINSNILHLSQMDQDTSDIRWQASNATYPIPVELPAASISALQNLSEATLASSYQNNQTRTTQNGELTVTGSIFSLGNA